MDKRASVCLSFNLVLGDVRKCDARDLLMALRQLVLITLYEKLKGLPERVGLTGTGSRFQTEALSAVKAGKYFGQRTFAGFLCWV